MIQDRDCLNAMFDRFAPTILLQCANHRRPGSATAHETATLLTDGYWCHLEWNHPLNPVIPAKAGIPYVGRRIPNGLQHGFPPSRE